MDSVPPLGVPHTLLDFLATKAESARRQRPEPGSGAKAKRVPLGKDAGWGEDYAVLVQEDKLFVRVAAPAPGAQAGAVMGAFRGAFPDLWGRIPGHDCQCLLGNWRGPQEAPLPYDCPLASHPKPLIQIVDAGPWSPSYPVCNKLGNELNFPLSLVAGHPRRLPYEIARALAMALMFANRRHWRLVIELIEAPLERWERRQGARATEAARDRKLDALEAEHVRVYESEIAQTLRRWGVGGP